jgi:hypothetical protein
VGQANATPATTRNRPARTATTASTNHVLSVTVKVTVSSGPPSVAMTSASGACSCLTVRVTGPCAESCWRHRSARPRAGGSPDPTVRVCSTQSRTPTPVADTTRASPSTSAASEGLARAIQTVAPSAGVAVTTTSDSTRLSTEGRMITGSVVAGRAVNCAVPEDPSWVANQAPMTVSTRPRTASSAPTTLFTIVVMGMGSFGLTRGVTGAENAPRRPSTMTNAPPSRQIPRGRTPVRPRSRLPPRGPHAAVRTARRAARRRASRARSRPPPDHGSRPPSPRDRHP